MGSPGGLPGGLAIRKGAQMRVHRAECWGPTGLGREGGNKGYSQRKSVDPGAPRWALPRPSEVVVIAPPPQPPESLNFQEPPADVH